LAMCRTSFPGTEMLPGLPWLHKEHACMHSAHMYRHRCWRSRRALPRRHTKCEMCRHTKC